MLMTFVHNSLCTVDSHVLFKMLVMSFSLPVSLLNNISFSFTAFDKLRLVVDQQVKTNLKDHNGVFNNDQHNQEFGNCPGYDGVLSLVGVSISESCASKEDNATVGHD